MRWRWGGLIAIAGLLIAIVGALVLAGQSIHWLRTSRWVEIEARNLWGGDPNWSWLGLRQIAEWIGRQSFAAVVFIAGVGVSLIGLKIMESAD